MVPSWIGFHCAATGTPNFLIILFTFLGPFQRHMEVPRLGAELELQLLAYTTATAMWDLSCVYDLQHSLWQHSMPDPLREARDKPTSSWILVRFIFAVPQRELHHVFFKHRSINYCFLTLCLKEHKG